MAVREVVAAKRKLEEVIRLLRGAGREAWAGGFEASLHSMDGWYATKEALFAIGRACRSKDIGDLYIPGLSCSEWSRHVEELHDSCAVAFNLLDRLPEEERDRV